MSAVPVISTNPSGGTGAPPAPSWLCAESERSLQRLWPRISRAAQEEQLRLPSQFEGRLRDHWPRLFELLYGLYGGHYDFFYHLEELLLTIARSAGSRAADLRELDLQREQSPGWFQSERMFGAIAYVNLFAGDLQGLRTKIPYLKELGVTYLHLMPLFRAPEEESDGGYAVSSYREVDPAVGTVQELAELAAEFRSSGISLCLDFVFNHTSDEHAWAQAAREGDPEHLDYYITFPDRTLPDAYERTLRDIFPTVRRGSFTWNEQMQRWVWTTFHSYQWDLNYANPAVFRAMAEEMLFLANAGVEVLRLDAVAFIWKRMGTTCENQPEAHQIIQAMNAVARIAAPALLFKSEAIVHPDEVARYISPEECQLSYNPLLMALLWETLATREVRLLAHSIARRNRLPANTVWVNYIRCHDDIGWTFDDEDARQVGIDPHGHRRFLNAFYTGRFPGSFARGVPFQENPVTGDARISGMLASLAGLEAALRETGDPGDISTAVDRILLLNGTMLGVGGIPLLYMGDEIAMLNEYSYAHDASTSEDSRWVHRPPYDWAAAEKRHQQDSIEGRVCRGLLRMLEIRRTNPAFGGNHLEVIDSGNAHVLAFLRENATARVIVISNFSEHPQILDLHLLRPYALSYKVRDLISGETLEAKNETTLKPHAVMYLEPLPDEQ